ncbi:MAG: hypothetical protein F6K42_28440 [Leptolyngbya sp. SIO1D8]|nr:hypothetical protein [Leptolyngbya sp. SIO1D8]
MSFPDHQELSKGWWKTRGSHWTSQLRNEVVKHRNIGHHWNFNTEQKNLLQTYHDANQLSLECLNSDCNVSRKVRQEIEDSLLLPIEVIEQQFPSQRRQETQ